MSPSSSKALVKLCLSFFMFPFVDTKTYVYFHFLACPLWASFLPKSPLKSAKIPKLTRVSELSKRGTPRRLGFEIS
jgi:hypothetical protein